MDGKRADGQTEYAIKTIYKAKGSIRMEESKYKLFEHQDLRCSKAVISIAYEK